MVGVAAAELARAPVVVAGTAGLVAGGALSMAAGEYVSVSSQADAERADLARIYEDRRLHRVGGTALRRRCLSGRCVTRPQRSRIGR